MRVLRTFAAAAALLPALLAPAKAHVPDGASFVAAFREACLPQRLSYDGMMDLASTLGWQQAAPGTSEELAAVLALADEAIAKGGGKDWTFDRTAYSRIIAGKLHHLVVSRVDAPGVARVISCALYDFGATASVDPEYVSPLVGAKHDRYFVNDGFHAHEWNEPSAMPGTFQIVLNFVAEDSPHIARTGFSGLVLKIDSNDPDAAAPGASD